MSEYSSNFVIFFLKLPAHIPLWHLGHSVFRLIMSPHKYFIYLCICILFSLMQPVCGRYTFYRIG